MALGLAMVLLSGPLLMLAMWWVTLWAVRGFARRAQSSRYL
jgi:predicted secreted protein